MQTESKATTRAFSFGWLEACRENLLHAVSVCPGCGTLGGDPFCQVCYEHVSTRVGFHHNHLGSGVQVYSPFLWAAQDPWLGPLIQGQKGGLRTRVYGDLAQRFWSQCLLRGWGALGGVLVPAPPRRQGHRDHAHIWAEALARSSGWPVLTCLDREGGGGVKQRWLSRGERLQVRMRARSRLEPGRPVVFVDDVVTSGATAHAAFRALREPRPFLVIAAAYRAARELVPPP